MENEKPVFGPEPKPRIYKTNIKKIAQYVSKRVNDFGYNVYISFSNKSHSRYLEVTPHKNRKIVVRISDHPAEKTNRWRYNFDIHTTEPRPGSLDYIEFLDTFKQVVGIKRPKAVDIELGEVPGKE